MSYIQRITLFKNKISLNKKQKNFTAFILILDLMDKQMILFYKAHYKKKGFFFIILFFVIFKNKNTQYRGTFSFELDTNLIWLTIE